MSFASELPSAIYGALQPGMGPGQTIPGYKTNVLNGSDFKILEFQVIAQSASPVTAIPSSLVTNTPWKVSAANGFKTLTFMPVNMGPTAIQGPFMINNSHFDMDVVNYSIPLNNIEVWTLTNQSPIAHPFHIHDVQFFITEMNGAAPPANMAGRKDVVLVPAGQTVKFITKFETFCDSMAMYMYHCHMLTHEDGGMMGQFNVICPKSARTNRPNPNDFLLYPNPASNTIRIKLSPNETISGYSVFDCSGKLILSKNQVNTSETELTLTTLSAGIYFIQIQSGDKLIHKKINIIK